MHRTEGNCRMVPRAMRTGQLCLFFLSHVFFSKRTAGWFSVGFDKKLKFMITFLKSLRSGFIMQGAVQAHGKRYPVIEPIRPGKAEERLTEAWKVN